MHADDTRAMKRLGGTLSVILTHPETKIPDLAARDLF
jgi:hypothetical protein